jgi:replication-associated recombination protein RarA
MPPLFERVRPREFDQVVGQDAITKRLAALEARNALGGRAYWISGLSGTGKTTLAKIIAGKVASEFATTEIPVKQLDAKTLDDWERSCRMRCIDGRGHALIVNEAHGLKPNTIYQLLDVLERLRDYCVVIFTTTNEGQAALFEDCMDTAPLLSRCVNLQLQSYGADLELAFAIHVRKVAQAENLDGRPISDYVNLVRKHKHNLRACFQSVDSGELL